MPHFWGPKKDKKVINPSTKCLISVKIAILTPHIIAPPLVNVGLIFDLQKYVNWLCVFLEVNPCFQRAHVFCMDLQPAADPYNVVWLYVTLNETLIPQNSKTCFWGMSVIHIGLHARNLPRSGRYVLYLTNAWIWLTCHFVVKYLLTFSGTSYTYMQFGILHSSDPS